MVGVLNFDKVTEREREFEQVSRLQGLVHALPSTQRQSVVVSSIDGYRIQM
jgi:hypothetical protein